MYDRIIRESRAPERVKKAFDKLLSTGNPIPTVDEGLLYRFVRIAEVSNFAVEVLRSNDDAWPILATGRYEPPPPELFDTDAAILRNDMLMTLFWAVVVDAMEAVPFEDTLQPLADVADRSIHRALAAAWQELSHAYGEPEGTGGTTTPGFCVLGMGKLGGRELNFSSDIDLIFLYREDGETSGGNRAKIENVIFYTKLATRAVELLSSRALSPHAYRVDMRLRPQGNSGPLVQSIDATLRYYEREGSSWERQALLKARCAGGDQALGAEFLGRITPFVYRRYLDRDTIQQIENIKARIESQAKEHGRRHVKLSFGGIREIEFIVQIMQLADGGRCEAVRTPSTLTALERLKENSYLTGPECAQLRKHYLFLRRVEHRLQMLDCRQTHLIPEEHDEMEYLARGLGLEGAEELWSRYLSVTTSVRQLYEGRFNLSREISVTDVEEKVINILDEGRDSDAQKASLYALGLKDESMSELRKLSRGSIADPPTSSVRRLFIRSTAVWLPKLLKMPNPDAALKRLARMVEGYGTKAMLYDIFAAHETVADLIVNIAGLSQPLARLIVRDPSALEALLSPGGVTGQRNAETLAVRYRDLREGISDERLAMTTLRTEESLRIGVRFILGLSDAREAGAQYTSLSELLLGETEFTIVALGRFGGSNLGPVSDLDLVFVTKGDTEEATRQVRGKLVEWESRGLKIDARLRPMGRTSPLVVQADSLRKYFRDNAETWERIAWSQSRIVNPAEDSAAEIEGLIEEFLFEKEFGAAELADVAAMRKRLLPKGFRTVAADTVLRELKRGKGGLIDIDFAAAVARINSRSRELDPTILLANEPGLVEAYRFLRTLEKAIFFTLGREMTGDEGPSDLHGIQMIMERHGMNIDDALAHRRYLAERETGVSPR